MSINLFQTGNFRLNSGDTSTWKIECDALTDEDWTTLAGMVRLMVGPFSSVEGVPQGGLKLAEALQPYRSEHNLGRHLLVDDVLTTGGSLQRLYNSKKQEPYQSIIGAVVFARGQCPLWVMPLFQIERGLWITPRQ